MSRGGTLTSDIGSLLQKELENVLDAPTAPIRKSDTQSDQQQERPQTLFTLDDSALKEVQVPADPRIEQHHQEPQEEFFTKDLVDINRTNVYFTKNMLYPGSIDQVDVSIGLKDEILADDDNSSAYLLRIIATCHNAQFNDLDQYVFSVRSNQRFQYYEQVRFRIRKKEKAQVKVAVKVPIVKTPYTIEGTLTIQLENTIPIQLPIQVKSQMPTIVCLKDLFQTNQQTHVIKIPAKKNVIRLPPIPFKNTSNFNFVMDAEVVTTEDFSDRAFDIISQNTINCMANSPFFVNMQLKNNMNYRGIIPKTDTIRKVLILKVKNSTVFFHYPIEAYVYESSSSSSMS